MALTSVKAVGPTNTATVRTYERRRATLLTLISMLAAAENTHHMKAVASDRADGQDPKWKDCTALGKAISEVGSALLTLGVSAAEVDMMMRVMR